MEQYNKLQVEAIKCGSVIDHIPAKIGFKLLTLFRLTETEQRITIGLNLPSKKIKKKDIIKLENTFLTDEQINQLAICAPYVTVNHINNYQLVGKIFPVLPDYIEATLMCPNINCISHSNAIKSSFKLKKRKKNINLKCKYCEKEFVQDVVLSF